MIGWKTSTIPIAPKKLFLTKTFQKSASEPLGSEATKDSTKKNPKFKTRADTNKITKTVKLERINLR